MKLTKLLNDVTSAPTSGSREHVDETPRTFHAKITGTGALTATVVVEVSNDSQAVEADMVWVALGTCTLSGTTSDSTGFGSVVPWFYTRARLTAISGTGATVNVTMGV